MIFYVIQLSSPLINLSTLVTDYKKAVGASSRIYEIMEEPTELLNVTQASEINGGSLIFENVDFKYGTKPILSDVNFEIPPSKVMVVIQFTILH